MRKHDKCCFHNRTFINYYQKGRSEQAGQAPLHGYYSANRRNFYSTSHSANRRNFYSASHSANRRNFYPRVTSRIYYNAQSTVNLVTGGLTLRVGSTSPHKKKIQKFIIFFTKSLFQETAQVIEHLQHKVFFPHLLHL